MINRRRNRGLDKSKTASSNYYLNDLTDDERKVFEDGASAIRDVIFNSLEDLLAPRGDE
jgi:hypothetical protein